MPPITERIDYGRKPGAHDYGRKPGTHPAPMLWLEPLDDNTQPRGPVTIATAAWVAHYEYAYTGSDGRDVYTLARVVKEAGRE